MSEFEQRIVIAKQAVKTVRTKSDYALRAVPNSIILTSPDQWAIGVIGILDYVLTGNSDKILLHEVRYEVRKLQIQSQEKEKK